MVSIKISFAFFLVISNILLLNAQTQRIVQQAETLYLSNVIVVKYKDLSSQKSENGIKAGNALLELLQAAQLLSSKQMFASSKTNHTSSLEKIYSVEYAADIDPIILSSKISKFSEVEWAEPKYVYKVDFVPNDPSYSAQYAMIKIKAQEAWDISTGDTSIVIAIIDTGVDWDHPDLSANIWRNWNETPSNGIDDDNNGYIDDVRGWDFGGLTGIPDNNPMEDQPDHGTHVAGDASAVTNNSIGVASIGFKSKIMPVKTTRNDYRSPSNSPYIVFGFEGIKYAADNGAKVINCSWGGGGYSLLGQEVIDYATSLGALVVAAAGNNNFSLAYYPANYKNVLSVAATDESDFKASFSNYGSGVDVSAPGQIIYSTWQNDSYTFGSGTSFSSPITAGLAALVTAKFSAYNPGQIAEQIRTNCDDINSVNPGYINQLGRGRINAFKSLFNINSKSVRAIDVNFSDELPGGNGDGVLQPGEIITVRCSFINYLNPTSNLGVYLESSNNFSTVQNGILIAGAKAMLDTFNNNTNAYTFQINQNVPQNSVLTFNLNYLDAGYLDFQVVEAIANPTYATQSGNNVALTITSKGTLGFNDYSTNSQGDGFKYLDGSNLMYEGAFMLAVSSSKISDCARGNTSSIQNGDFATVQPFVLSIPGVYADMEGSCIFNDDGAGLNKISITTKLHSFSFNDTENENYILLRYALTNTTSSVINNLYAGLFFDWDFADAADDFTAYDTLGNLGYVYRVGGNPNEWVASALVSSTDYGFWAINNGGGDGGFSISDGFGDSEKWQSLSSGIGKPQAGAGDVSHVVSGGPFSIQPNETINVAFAIAGGLNINDLRIAIVNARNKYSQLPTSVGNNTVYLPNKFLLSQNFPNPFNPATKISYSIPLSMNGEALNIQLRVYDILGNELATLVNEKKPAGYYEIEFIADHLSSGIYFYRLSAGDYTETKKMLLLK